MQNRLQLFIFTILIFMGISSFAENAKKEARRQSISFEDELVEGNTQKPDLFFLFQKKNF